MFETKSKVLLKLLKYRSYEPTTLFTFGVPSKNWLDQYPKGDGSLYNTLWDLGNNKRRHGFKPQRYVGGETLRSTRA